MDNPPIPNSSPNADQARMHPSFKSAIHPCDIHPPVIIHPSIHPSTVNAVEKLNQSKGEKRRANK
jgi:hypothetical protein